MTDAFRETAAGTARGPSTRPWAWQTLAPRLVDAEKRLRYRQHRAVVTRAHLAWGTLRRSHVSSSLGGGGPRRRPPNSPHRHPMAVAAPEDRGLGTAFGAARGPEWQAQGCLETPPSFHRRRS